MTLWVKCVRIDRHVIFLAHTNISYRIVSYANEIDPSLRTIGRPSGRDNNTLIADIFVTLIATEFYFVLLMYF